MDKLLKERIGNDQDDPFGLIKINIDDFPELFEKFGVELLPTLIIVKNRISLVKCSGSLNPSNLDDFFEKIKNGKYD